MQDCRENRSLATPRPIDSAVTWRRCARHLLAASCALVLLASAASAQESIEMPAMDGDAFDSGAPMTDMGGGEYFSQELGTLLRLRYSTQSYGQDRRGNFDLGTMRITNFEDAIGFFDGQVTLSDVNGVGYDLGVGFRWLHETPFAGVGERISGVSLWTDGTSTASGSFFPQIGLSYESLGETWDFRANAYIPVGQATQVGAFKPTGDIVFSENFLVLEALADQNKSFEVGEIELARRIMPDRDAWAFAGGYALSNNDDDTAGYRLGFRGYAYPDLLLQLAVSDDSIFHTNAAFSVTWFVGRTRSDYQPACGLVDRMREPVMRNDYVTLKRTTVAGGEPLTNTDGDPFRFVHVNSAAPAGGDGTYEHPLNNVGNVEANSQVSDIVLLYANSVFNGQSTLVLQDSQRLLGEGDGQTFTVDTLQEGIVDIPETSPGARDGARAIISGMTGAGAVELADANEVANFNIDGTGSAANAEGVFSPMAGAGNPNIHDMNISNVAGTGIQFTPLTRTDTTNPALKTVAGNVTIDNIVFRNMAGVEMDIDSFTSEDVTNANVTLNETIAVSNIDSQFGSDIGLWLHNTHAGHTATITNYANGLLNTAGTGGGSAAEGVLRFSGAAANDFAGNVTLTNIDVFDNEGYAIDMANVASGSTFTITSGNGLAYDGQSNAAGGLRFDSFNGTFTGNSSTLKNGTLSGVTVTGTSDGTITLASTVTFDSIDPDPGLDEAVINVGPAMGDSFTGSLTVGGAVTHHDTGRLVSIQNMTDSTATVTLSGDMTDEINAASTGIRITDNTDGTILFTGDLKINTTASKGIEIASNNANVDINFNGLVDIISDGIGAEGFDASGGGTLTMLGTTNTITSNGSTALTIDGMTISNGGVNVGKVNATGGTNGIRLVNDDGGPIVIGTVTDTAPTDGIITGTTAEGILVQNSANVTISGIQVDATAGQSGVHVHKDSTGTQIVDLNNLKINGGDIGIETTGNGTGTLNMTVNDTDVTNSSDIGVSFDNIDTGTIALNNVTVDGMGAMATAGVSITNSNANFTIDGDSVIQGVAGTAFNVNSGTTGTISMAGDITNTAGRSIAVQNRTGGTVTHTGTVTDSGAGILVNANSGGTTNLQGTYALTTGANDAVTITGNTGSTTNIIGDLDITTDGGSGFVAMNGGTLSVTGPNNKIASTNLVAGQHGLRIENMTLGSVNFESVNSTGGDNGIRLVNNLTGTVTIGDTNNAVGEGGTIKDSLNDGVFVQNTNVTLNGVTVNDAGNAAGENAVSLQHTNTTNMSVALNDLTVNTTHDGVDVNGTGASGTFNVSGTGGTIAATETGLEVQGRVSTASFSQDINNTAGRSINVHGVTAGTVNHTGDVVDSGTGVIVTGNTGGSTNLLGTYALSTTTNDAMTITNNTGASVDVSGLNINTTSGNGFVAGGGGTLNVTGTTNKVTTTSGVGVDIQDMTIGSAGAEFQSVNVNGATNGIVLQNLTTTGGSQVAIGNSAGAADSGGSLTTTGDAIVVTNVQNVDLNNIHVVSAGGQGLNIDQTVASTTVMDVTINGLNLDTATGDGINVLSAKSGSTFDLRLINSTIDDTVVMSATGSSGFGLLLDNNDITTTATDIAFSLSFSGSAHAGNVTINNGNTFTSANATAFNYSENGTNVDVNFLLDGNTITNNSAGSESAVFLVNGGATMNANVVNNSFMNSLAANRFLMTSDASNTRINLNLDNNTANGNYELVTTNKGAGFNFGVQDRDNTNANNIGTVNFNPIITDFEDITGPVTMPSFP